MKPYQLRLPLPRGDRYPNECGHPNDHHYALNMCAACYARDYRTKNLAKRQHAERMSKRRRAAALKGSDSAVRSY